MTSKSIQLYIHLNPEEIELTKQMRDMRNIGQLGTGDLEFIINNQEDYVIAKIYIQMSYELN